MSVTAARLGSAPITVDWSNLASVATPGGPRSRLYAPDATFLRESWFTRIQPALKSQAGFYEAPVQEEISGWARAREAAAQFSARRIENLIFVGAGPSSLAAKGLISALVTPSTPRFHFISDPDPAAASRLMKELKPHGTVICIAPGSALETSALVLVLLEWLGKEHWKEQVAGFPSGEQRELSAFLQAQGIPCAIGHPSSGSGSASLFSPAVLFALALSGHKVDEFLLGAKQVRDHLEKASPEKSPLILLASEFIRHSSQRRVHCFCPFNADLDEWMSWASELWSEGISASSPGFSPLLARGGTRLLPLLAHGPDDKVTLFVRAEQASETLKVPRTPSSISQAASTGFRFAEGHSLQELMSAEYRAHVRMLARNGRPSLTFQMDRLDERALGALTFSFCFLTQAIGILADSGAQSRAQETDQERQLLVKEALDLSRSSERLNEEDENSPVNRLRRSSPN